MSELTELLNQCNVKRMVLTQTIKVLVSPKKEQSIKTIPNEELPRLTERLMEKGEILTISLERLYAVMEDESYTYYLTLKKDE